MLCLPSLAHHLFYSKLLGLSDTDEDKFRNAHLSHEIWYSYPYSNHRVGISAGG